MPVSCTINVHRYRCWPAIHPIDRYRSHPWMINCVWVAHNNSNNISINRRQLVRVCVHVWLGMAWNANWSSTITTPPNVIHYYYNNYNVLLLISSTLTEFIDDRASTHHLSWYRHWHIITAIIWNYYPIIKWKPINVALKCSIWSCQLPRIYHPPIGNHPPNQHLHRPSLPLC